MHMGWYWIQGVVVESSPDDSERFIRLTDFPMPMDYGLPEEFRCNLTKRGSNTRFPQLALVNEQGILCSFLLFGATMAV